MCGGSGPPAPSVLFALFSYNQEAFIAEAVNGALAQDFGPLEIVISDDHSTDRTFEIIQELVSRYEGPHTVEIRQNPKNLGLAHHVSTTLLNSHCDVVVLAAGDDVSLPTRTRLSVNLLMKFPEASSVLFSGDVIDSSGRHIGQRKVAEKDLGRHTVRIQRLPDLLALQAITFGASRAIRREAFAYFGPLLDDCPTEDTPLLLRSLLRGQSVLSSETGILYRRHGNNLSEARTQRELDIEGIYHQYLTDINFASRTQLISNRTERRLVGWVARDREFRELKMKLNEGLTVPLWELVGAIIGRKIRPKGFFKLVAVRFGLTRL